MQNLNYVVKGDLQLVKGSNIIKHFVVQDTLVLDSGTMAADFSFLLQEKDVEIETLQATLDQREQEKLAHQEELTELRRLAGQS